MIEIVVLIWCANRISCPIWLNVVLGAVLLCKIYNFIMARIMRQRIKEVGDRIIEQTKDIIERK